MARKKHSSSHTTKTTPPPSKPSSASEPHSDSHRPQMDQENQLSHKGKSIKKENVFFEEVKKENVAKMPEESPSVIENEPAKDEFVMGESSNEMFRFREMFRFEELNALKRWMELLGEPERQEYDRRLKKLKVEEVKLHLRRAELVEEQAELILMALQGSS